MHVVCALVRARVYVHRHRLRSCQPAACVLACVSQPSHECLRRSLNIDKLLLLFLGSVSRANITAVNKRAAHAAVKCESTPCLAVNISLLLGRRWIQQRVEEKTLHYSDIIKPTQLTCFVHLMEKLQKPVNPHQSNNDSAPLVRRKGGGAGNSSSSGFLSPSLFKL